MEWLKGWQAGEGAVKTPHPWIPAWTAPSDSPTSPCASHSHGLSLLKEEWGPAHQTLSLAGTCTQVHPPSEPPLPFLQPKGSVPALREQDGCVALHSLVPLASQDLWTGRETVVQDAEQEFPGSLGPWLKLAYPWEPWNINVLGLYDLPKHPEPGSSMALSILGPQSHTPPPTLMCQQPPLFQKTAGWLFGHPAPSALTWMWLHPFPNTTYRNNPGCRRTWPLHPLSPLPVVPMFLKKLLNRSVTAPTPNIFYSVFCSLALQHSALVLVKNMALRCSFTLKFCLKVVRN